MFASLWSDSATDLLRNSPSPIDLLRTWPTPAIAIASPPQLQHPTPAPPFCPRTARVVGQAGPGPNLGWPARLAKALEAKVPAWRIHNRAVEYTTSQLWYDLVMNKTTPEEWKHYSLVILSLSVNNEGFLLTQDRVFRAVAYGGISKEEEKLQQIEQHFLKHVRRAEIVRAGRAYSESWGES
ncbi:unnamed protein product [Durusdinium trenchii]|uniref:Uncharacterized protein n=2 Tax=Durusdinium trenchii TaxID=1381693 RepID=A0ABP0I3Z2_9DINO